MLEDLGRRARRAGRRLAALPTDAKNAALLSVADAVERRADDVLAANAEDVADARAAGRSDALVDRLLLTPERVAALAADTRRVVDLPDPVGRRYDERTLPNGLRLYKRRLPLGVVGCIYEARPNVTVDVATLCLKAGNAVLLRGGSETLRSNRALTAALREGLAGTDVPEDAVAFIDDPDRALVRELLRLDRYVDVIIPRGGSGLHRLCREESTIPVITGGIGICHLYVDESADLEAAEAVVENAKVQRPSVCNALDTLLVHMAAARTFLPPLARRLAAHGVELRVDDRAGRILADGDHGAHVQPAGADDWDREWLGLTLGIRVVDDLETAVEHIQDHSTEHSDGILTQDRAGADRFVRALASAAVYVNASTRFTDGGQFGLGAEVAVSTQKLHARGPMGLEELTTYGWVGEGDMHVRA